MLGGVHIIKHACPARCLIKQFDNLRVCAQVGRFDKQFDNKLILGGQSVAMLEETRWTSMFDCVYPALNAVKRS